LARTLPVKGLGVVTSGQNGPAGSLMTAILVFLVVLSMKYYLYERNWTGLFPVVAEGRWQFKKAEKVHL
jgi:hypothetical protein